MRALRLAVPFVVVLGLSGCGSDEVSVMPDVTGKRLDVALSDIERAGMDKDDVEVLGGGLFGVVDESNWTVCEQDPAGGTSTSVKPRLTVDRDCGGDAPDDESSEAPAEKQSEAAPEPTPTKEALPEILTPDNNADLAALLKTEDPAVAGSFAKKYAGRSIEFDGNIATMNSHGNYKTRFDALIYVGDFSTTEGAPGPAFQFRDVNFYDFKLTGPNKPDQIGTGDNLHIVAEVVKFERRTGLFLLRPVSTKIR